MFEENATIQHVSWSCRHELSVGHQVTGINQSTELLRTELEMAPVPSNGHMSGGRTRGTISGSSGLLEIQTSPPGTVSRAQEVLAPAISFNNKKSG